MREPKNSVPLRSVRANAAAKEVHDAFLNQPNNLKRRSETKVAAASAKQPKIDHARPQPKFVEVKSRVDTKIQGPSRANSRDGDHAVASSGKETSRQRAAGGSAKPVKSLSTSGPSFAPSSLLQHDSSLDSAFAPSPAGSVRSTASSHTSAETLRDQLRAQMDDNAMLTASLEAIQAKEYAAKSKAEALKQEVERERAEKEAEAAERQRAEAEVASLRTQLQSAAAAAAAAAETEKSLREATAQLEQKLAERDAEIEKLVERGCAQEELRRQMHETISELRGNIRVFCRVRPTDSAGSAASKKTFVRLPANQIEPTALELLPTDASGSAISTANVKAAKFKFDRVFGEASTQEDIFREVSQLTQSALDGHRVCIFAYGQTGSGKTFTMTGAGGEQRGVVPRAAQQVFDVAKDLRSLGWSYQFDASCLEIYNEELRDLLPDQGAAGEKATGQKAPPAKLKVSDANGIVAVPGLKTAPVSDAASLESLLAAASRVRATAATKCNEQSSRSHYLFRMRIRGHNAATQESVDGELNLIDLAGSERTKESGVSGDAMREANAINKSLSSLGDVISAMGKKQDGGKGASQVHVPYRNSKLTHVLQNALSGSAKTLMFVNVNPTHHSESLSSLRFASKVGNVEVGPAVANKERAK